MGWLCPHLTPINDTEAHTLKQNDKNKDELKANIRKAILISTFDIMAI